MKRRRSKGSRRRGAVRPHAATEWVGGSATAPFRLHDRPEPYRPELVLWLEMPAGHIVERDVVMPEEAEGAVARTPRHALKPEQEYLVRVSSFWDKSGTFRIELRPH